MTAKPSGDSAYSGEEAEHLDNDLDPKDGKVDEHGKPVAVEPDSDPAPTD